MSSAGGTIALNDVATVTFAAGSVPNTTTVSVSKVESSTYANDFKDSAASMFSASGQNQYQVVIDVSGDQPTTAVSVSLAVPDSLKASAPAGSVLRVFDKQYSVTEDESEESVQMLPEFFAKDATMVNVSIPPEDFSSVETNFAAYRAVIFLAFAPSPQLAPSQKVAASSPSTTAPTDVCKGPLIQFPVDPSTPVGRTFGVKISPINHKQTPHKGVDLTVAAGTPVLAAANGTVIESRFQFNKETGFGWGNTIVIRHDDGSATRYGHLKDGTLMSVNHRVLVGNQIALSDTSGGVTGPHLHLEYAPKGMPVVDPSPCLFKVIFLTSICTRLPSIPSTTTPPGPPTPLYRVSNTGRVSVPVGVLFTGWSNPNNGSGNPTRTACDGWDQITDIFGTKCVRPQSGPPVTAWNSTNLFEGGAPSTGTGQVTTPSDGRPAFNSFTEGPALVCN